MDVMNGLVDMLFATAAENHGKKQAPAAQQFKMVPITELTREQIQKYAPEIDLNAAGSAFAKVRVPVEPTPAKRPTRKPAPKAQGLMAAPKKPAVVVMKDFINKEVKPAPGPAVPEVP